MFDLSQQFPPLRAPEKPGLDVKRIQELVVVATASSHDVRSWVEEPDCDPKVKAIGNLALALLDVVEALTENGIIPVTAAGTGSGRAAQRQLQVKVTAQDPCVKALKDCLEKADKETVLFDANLGQDETFNRNTLAAGLAKGLAAVASEKAGEDPVAVAEAKRQVDDALSCVNEMDFLGNKSKKFENKFNIEDPRNNTFCTMPVKFTFDSGAARINFERTIKATCGLSAKMSLPPVIRKEMTAFTKALKQRYPEKIITVRTDVKHSIFRALMKNDKDKSWTNCREVHVIRPEIMQPGYNTKPVVLEPLVSRPDDEESPSQMIVDNSQY
jgi:hypothetical protein